MSQNWFKIVKDFLKIASDSFKDAITIINISKVIS